MASIGNDMQAARNVRLRQAISTNGQFEDSGGADHGASFRARAGFAGALRRAAAANAASFRETGRVSFP